MLTRFSERFFNSSRYTDMISLGLAESFKTSIATWIKNPFRRTREHNHISTQLSEYFIFSLEIIPCFTNFKCFFK